MWSIQKGHSSWLRVRRRTTRIAVTNGVGSSSTPFSFSAADFQIAAVADIRDQFDSKPAPFTKTVKDAAAGSQQADTRIAKPRKAAAPGPDGPFGEMKPQSAANGIAPSGSPRFAF